MPTKQTITIQWKGEMKPDRRGIKFFSVKVGDKKFLTCYNLALNPFLQVGNEYVVMVEKIGDFEKIIDVVSDDLGIAPDFDHLPQKSHPDVLRPKPTSQLDRIEKLLSELHKTIVEAPPLE